MPVMPNPIANPRQFAAEDEVRAMARLPVITQARAQAAALWKIAFGEDVPAEALSGFDSAMDEYVGNYLFKAAACDPAVPGFVRNFMAPYHWQGQDVPGARMGGDNPDNCYRLAGIAHGGRYVVRLAPIGRAPAHVSFTLVGNWGTSVTIQTLELGGLERDADGSAVITIDAQPAAGRANHLTTAPHVKFLFVRDSLGDWAEETPLALTIARVDDAVVRPLSLEEKAERAAFRLLEEVPLYYWFTRLGSGRPANRLDQPVPVGNVGGLITQASSLGRFRLGPDEAAILRYHPAGADYTSIALYNWWFQSIEAHARQTSLTAAMSERNADGSVTCVVSAQDPGIANWIDTAGLTQTLPLVRWQGLPKIPIGAGPQLDLQIVPFAEISGAGGRIDIAARAAAYRRRITPTA